MRVLVAVTTRAEGNAEVAGLGIRSGCVALGAGDLGVQSGQRVARLRMIKLR